MKRGMFWLCALLLLMALAAPACGEIGFAEVNRENVILISNQNNQ